MMRKPLVVYRNRTWPMTENMETLNTWDRKIL